MERWLYLAVNRTFCPRALLHQRFSRNPYRFCIYPELPEVLHSIFFLQGNASE